MRVGIGETVQAARLVHKVKPIYPPKSTLALDAVRERKYKPTTLNGEPVEVDTEIDIGFGWKN